jgi:hypothetical protein
MVSGACFKNATQSFGEILAQAQPKKCENYN